MTYYDHDLRKAVIPVGGLGTRLLPMTKVLPKELLPVGRRPMIQYVVEELRAAGLEYICLVTGRKKTLIQEHFDHDPELVRLLQNRGRDGQLAELAYLESGLHLTYIRQGGPEGLADAVKLAEDFAGEQPFVVALGDSIICEVQMGALLRKMIREHIESGAGATVAVEPVSLETGHNYDIVCPAEGTGPEDTAFGVSNVLPQIAGDEAPTNLVIAARFVFGSDIFDAISEVKPGPEGEMQLTDALRILRQQGTRVQAVRLSPDQRRYDIGSYEGYFRAFLEFALMDRYFGDRALEYLQQLTAQHSQWEGDEQ
jgi:UTP--glucose-1-phosphate uridylyltransferase